MSPRQKMINMMYLVLMALLALNVSKEILKSFHLFEQSFNNAADAIDRKNTTTLGALQKQMDEKPGKLNHIWIELLKLRKLQMVLFLISIKHKNYRGSLWRCRCTYRRRRNGSCRSNGEAC